MKKGKYISDEEPIMDQLFLLLRSINSMIIDLITVNQHFTK